MTHRPAAETSIAESRAGRVRVVLWGGTGQAKVVNDCIHALGWHLLAVFDRAPGVLSPVTGVPIRHGREGLEAWLAETGPSLGDVGCIVTIGGARGRARLAIQEYCATKGLGARTIVHPTAYVAHDATIGAGSQLLPHAVVGASASLGRSVIVNTAASVDHECRLGDGVHVGPGARLAGCIEVGAYAFIGTGAIVLPRLVIGEGAIVGAGAVVTRPVEPYTVVVGNPARALRKVSPAESDAG